MFGFLLPKAALNSSQINIAVKIGTKQRMGENAKKTQQNWDISFDLVIACDRFDCVSIEIGPYKRISINSKHYAIKTTASRRNEILMRNENTKVIRKKREYFRSF